MHYMTLKQCHALLRRSGGGHELVYKLRTLDLLNQGLPTCDSSNSSGIFALFKRSTRSEKITTIKEEVVIADYV